MQQRIIPMKLFALWLLGVPLSVILILAILL